MLDFFNKWHKIDKSQNVSGAVVKMEEPIMFTRSHIQEKPSKCFK